MLDAVLDAAAILVVLVAAVTDLRSRRIPNWLTLPAIVLAPLALAASGRWLEAALAVAGVLICGAIPAVLCWRGTVGAGDVKLCAALGALAGPIPGLHVELAAFVLVAGWSLVHFLRHPDPESRREVPFAPALAAGAAFACFA